MLVDGDCLLMLPALLQPLGLGEEGPGVIGCDPAGLADEYAGLPNVLGSVVIEEGGGEFGEDIV